MTVRFVILGAGAVGATIGGLLAEAGREVLFLARGEHARTMASDGLTLSTRDRGTRTLAVPVVESVGELALHSTDILLACVKSQDAPPLFAQVAGLLLADTGAPAGELPIVCAQNGIANEIEALRRFGDVYGMCVQLPAQIDRPGHVSGTGSPTAGIIDIGRFPDGSDAQGESIAAHLRAAGFACEALDDIMAWKNRKLLANLNNALEVLVDPAEPDRSTMTEMFTLLREEGERILDAAGMTVTPMQDWIAGRVGKLERETHPANTTTSGRFGNSTLQSVHRGSATTETDYLNGEIVLQARLLGLRAPRNELIQRLMVEVLAGNRGVQAMPGDELLAALRDG